VFAPLTEIFVLIFNTVHQHWRTNQLAFVF